MQINKALTLFDYIGDKSKSTSILEDLVNKQQQNISGGIKEVDLGLNLGQFEETLDKIEKGEIELNSDTLENYFQFNKSKLSNEFNQLAEAYGINIDTEISVEDGKILVSGESKSATQLQQYLDADSRLNKLVHQTSRLSKLIEWDQAKQQAASYTQKDVPEQQIVDFLKEARQVVNDDNKLLFTNKGLGFISEGQTQILIDNEANKAEQEATKDNQ